MSVLIHRPAAIGGVTECDFSRCHVLVLDPFIATRRLVSDILLRDMRAGQVRACGTAEEALRLLVEGGWNILFTDWSGDTNAIAVLKGLRAPNSAFRFLPVVVMSGYNSADEIRRARDAGMSEFMLKPFSAMVVQSRLKAITQAPRVFVESPDFFGPDRRRRHDAFLGGERRMHTNTRYADRRCVIRPHIGPERRQGRPGFQMPERRDGGR
jgi:two-component system chemotaxis response regulator CheY